MRSVFTLNQANIESFQNAELTIIRLTIEHPPPNQKQYGHLTVTSFKGSDNLYYFNSSAEILEDLGRQKEDISVFTPVSKSDRNYEHLYYRSTFDICKRANGLRSNSFMRAFMDGFMKGADHVLGNCI